MVEIQKSNPPQCPLVRGEDGGFPDMVVGWGEVAPSLKRGSREGLGFIPYDTKLIALARANRKNSTVAEQKIRFEILHSRQFPNYKLLRQEAIDRFIADFYCSSLRWVIEIDGDSHAEDLAYEVKRTQILQGHNLAVTRYTNHDVLHNISGIFDDMTRLVA